MLTTILRDEDYHSLVARADGFEIYGAFVALTVAARDRRQEGRAERVGDALKFNDSIPHLLRLTGIRQELLDRSLEVIGEVTAENGNKPWLYMDGGKLVIRTFFKANRDSGQDDWGGGRPGAGRPPKNQDDFKGGNQDDSTHSYPVLSCPNPSSSIQDVTESAREIFSLLPEPDVWPQRPSESTIMRWLDQNPQHTQDFLTSAKAFRAAFDGARPGSATFIGAPFNARPGSNGDWLGQDKAWFAAQRKKWERDNPEGKPTDDDYDPVWEAKKAKREKERALEEANWVRSNHGLPPLTELPTKQKAS